MKNTLIALLLVLPAGALLAQQRNDRPPRQVQQSFQKNYPEANDARWSRSGSEWHAEFTDRSPRDRGEMVAHYDQRGRHIDSHVPFDRQDVPEPVIRNTERRYRGARDFNYTRIERPGGGAYFRVQLNLNGRNKTVYMDDRGQEHQYNDHHRDY